MIANKKNMNTLKLRHLLCLILFTFIFSFKMINAQGAWTKNKGELYTQLSFSTIPSYDEIFSDNTYMTSREITDNTIQLYAEYGLIDKWTLIVNIPIKSISAGNIVDNPTFSPSITEDSKTALGNIQIGLKRKLYDKTFVLSGRFNIETNTGNFYADSGIRTGYDAWTFTPTLNLGKGYSNYFFQMFTGVEFRTNNYNSNFKIGGEFGYTAINNINLIAFLDAVVSFNNGDIILPQNNLETALYINNQEYVAFGLKGSYSFTQNFGLNLGLGGAISANNVAKQLALSGGVFYKMN